MEAVSEVKVNLEEIKKDFQVGLANANNVENDSKSQVVVLDSLKPRLQLGNTLVKLGCKFKNNLQFKLVTKDMPDHVKEGLQRFCEVKDHEVEIYKNAFDQYGSEHLSPEIIEMINKYANSPLAPLIEFELDKFNMMKIESKNLLANSKKEGE